MNDASDRFVVCIDNSDDDMDVQLHKIYRVIEDPDPRVAEDGEIRIIDDSGEDYLYWGGNFVAIEVPDVLRRSILAKAS